MSVREIVSITTIEKAAPSICLYLFAPEPRARAREFPSHGPRSHRRVYKHGERREEETRRPGRAMESARGALDALKNLPAGIYGRFAHVGPFASASSPNIA